MPGDFQPGNYEFEMTYRDVGRASDTQRISFSVIHPDYHSEEVLQEYRDNLEKADLSDSDRNDLILNKSELQYYVELQRAARSEDGSLSDTDMNDLVLSLGISDSRAEEIRSSSLRAQGGGY